MKRDKPQIGCRFDRPPPVPRWLIASHPNSPRCFLWLLLRVALLSNSPLSRALRLNAFCQILRQYPLRNGNVALLLKGPADEVARIGRLVRANNFFPEQVLSCSEAPLPLPQEVLDAEPMGDPRHLIIFGFEEDDSCRHPDLLKLVSHDAQINLSHACRMPVALGAYAVLVGSGRPEAVGALEELHAADQLPSPERASFVRFLHSSEYAQPSPIRASHLEDRLELHFAKSSADQMAPFVIAIYEHVGRDMAIYGNDCMPRPGQSIGAIVVISMSRRKPEVRDQLELIVREVAAGLEVRARLSWVIDDVRHPLPDIG